MSNQQEIVKMPQCEDGNSPATLFVEDATLRCATSKFEPTLPTPAGYSSTCDFPGIIHEDYLSMGSIRQLWESRLKPYHSDTSDDINSEWPGRLPAANASSVAPYNERRYQEPELTALAYRIPTWAPKIVDIQPDLRPGLASVVISPGQDEFRGHHLYSNPVISSSGFYHCPWEDQDDCPHKPDRLKCNYDKFLDSHLKPYRCKVCEYNVASFSSTACLLRHEREAHAMHGHGQKPFLCRHTGCDRNVPGNGFPRHWNLRDHERRAHNMSNDN